MSSEPIVRFRDVSKRFPTKRRPAGAAPPARAGAPVVDSVSFDAGAGEIVGIIGRNGAGKSTMLRLAAGVLAPTTGEIDVRGRVVPMIELGLSFHPDLSGWDNLPLTGALLGMSRDELDEATGSIVDFSGIERHMGLPIKLMSTGMVARLGFAVATHARADLLLVDEVLAVGDHHFQERCVLRIRDLATAGTTVLFVSHSLDLVALMCDRCLLLEEGRVLQDGTPAAVIPDYLGAAPIRSSTAAGSARIVRARIGPEVVPSGDSLTVEATVEVAADDLDLAIRSYCSSPGHTEASSVNHDLVDPSALRRAGTWELSGTVGPMATTAGSLHILLTIVRRVGPGRSEVVDEVALPFEVRSQEVGGMRATITGTWRIERRAEVAPFEAAPVDLERSGPVWFEQVSKQFGSRGATRLHESSGARDTALEAVSFDAADGGAIGIIGGNGAGKTTLLRLVADITRPTAGTVHVGEAIGALLALGAGFHGDMTGRENLAFSWRLMGGTAASLRATQQDIETFAGVEAAMDEPLKHFSTGMVARLAVAMVLELRPPVLIIDEALSVGDVEFRRRVTARIRELVADGTTLLFASHDLHLVRAVCGQVIRLDEGRVVDAGPTGAVLDGDDSSDWATAAVRPDARVRLSNLSISPTPIRWNEQFSVELALDVLQPTTGVALELSVRNAMTPDQRAAIDGYRGVLEVATALTRVEVPEEVFATPGRYELHGSIDGLPLVNEFDVVVAAVDIGALTILGETWEAVSFVTDDSDGLFQRPSSMFRVTWEAAPTRIGPAVGR